MADRLALRGHRYTAVTAHDGIHSSRLSNAMGRIGVRNPAVNALYPPETNTLDASHGHRHGAHGARALERPRPVNPPSAGSRQHCLKWVPRR